MGRAKAERRGSKNQVSFFLAAAWLLPYCHRVLQRWVSEAVGDSPVNCLLASTSNAAPFTDIGGEVAHEAAFTQRSHKQGLKALTSLCRLIKQKTAKEIAIIIPQWAFEYKSCCWTTIQKFDGNSWHHDLSCQCCRVHII
ncbi:hypothetical protein OROHE_017459 [Orobanche hederae]